MRMRSYERSGLVAPGFVEAGHGRSRRVKRIRTNQRRTASSASTAQAAHVRPHANFGERIGEAPWLDKLENVSPSHGVEHSYDTCPTLAPLPTPAHSSDPRRRPMTCKRSSSLSLRRSQCLFDQPTNCLGTGRKVRFAPPEVVELIKQVIMKSHMNRRSYSGRRPPALFFG